MMQRDLVARLALCLFALGAATSARAATGQQLYASCAACHGPRGEGNPALGAPAIAGQYESYLRRQLENFRAGVRGAHKADVYGAQMRAATVAVLRGDRDLAAIAKYVATLPPTSVRPVKFDVRNGNNLYQGKCGACHGGRAEGNEPLAAPRLAGLDAAYLQRQLRHFRDGVRGAHTQDKYGRQMSLMAATVTTERDVADVIGHIHAAGGTR
ncbi:MAG TPA: c-type cytochrome [Steroidobacteraceae bacterium]|nr:c-type cytochrome [Steroidobacteraceae bacterium]